MVMRGAAMRVHNWVHGMGPCCTHQFRRSAWAILISNWAMAPPSLRPGSMSAPIGTGERTSWGASALQRYSSLHGEADRGQPEAAADAAAAVQKRDDEHEAEGYEAYEVNPFARAPGSGIACVIWRLVSARGI